MCGVDLGDDLAVGPQHQPQHAVRAGMLRPHVDEHLVGADVELDDARDRRVCVAMIGASGSDAFSAGRLSAADAVIFQRHLVVLAQRMADPVFGAEDAPQVRDGR